MAWTEKEFNDNASGSGGQVYNRYTQDNPWFKWGTEPKDPERHISNAWKLYEAASKNTLESLILGDEKIRQSPNLLMNFGCASAGSADKTEYGLSKEEYDKLTQEERDNFVTKKDVSKEEFDKLTQEEKLKFVWITNDGKKLKMMLDPIKSAQEKRANAAKDAWNKVGRKLVDVVGPGSILNSEGWTPLLNDAYILAGVHGRQDFHWAAEGFDAEFGASSLSNMEKWKSYAVNHSVFWSDDGKEKGVLPRVFGRELIGLSIFGYQPRFTNHDMIFHRDYEPKVSATFDSYLNALALIKFHIKGKDSKVSINAALGEFLFGPDSDFLTTS